MTPFTHNIISVIKQIPRGKVLSYGRVAGLAGNPRGARQVVRILHSMSDLHDLPWHRVVNAKGQISLPKGRGYELQKALLMAEGVEFSLGNRLDLSRCLWDPDPEDVGPYHKMP